MKCEAAIRCSTALMGAAILFLSGCEKSHDDSTTTTTLPGTTTTTLPGTNTTTLPGATTTTTLHALIVPLAAPAQTTPADGATLISRTVTLKWSPVFGASSYGLELQSQGIILSRFWSTLHNGSVGGTSFSTTIPNNSSNYRCRWQVWAIDSHGNAGSASGWRTFQF